MEFELRTKFSMILSLLLLFLLIFSFRCSDNDNPTGPMDAAKFEIRADDLSIYSGGRMQLSAILTSSDGSITDVTPQTLWSNSPALVGTIDGNGLFTAINNVIGIETIRAEYGSEVTTVDVEVTRRAGFLGVSPVLASVQSGDDLQFMAAVTFQDGSEGLATDKVAWSVSPGVAASIEGNGLLKTIPGMTGIETVQASYHGLIANSEVEIQLQHPSRFDMVEIPAGVFEMGDDNGLDDEKPAHEVFVSAFEIGRYEVTNAEYARYLTEAFARGEIRHEHGFISKGKPPFLFVGLSKIDAPEFGDQVIVFVPGDLVDEGRFEALAGYENRPVASLHWFGATAFCDFYGLRLPTEAEWEKACRGGLQLEYGTEDGTISGDLANLAGTGGKDIFETDAPVGSFPPNPFGIYDMTGNVSEFIFDLYDAEYYQNSPSVDPSGRPGPVTIENLIWIIRGGRWNSPPQEARAARRAIIDEPHPNAGVSAWSGIRVVRALP